MPPPLLSLFLLSSILLNIVRASPPMCHCPNGGLGMTCPSPIQLNCPVTACPPAPPCNPFPTLPSFDQHNSIHGISQFTFPTLPPLGGSSFLQATTPLPLPVAPPTNAQESLLPINNQAQPQYPPPPPPPPPQQPIYQSSQVPVQPSNLFAEAPPPPPVDATTQGTTLPSELYVEADSPEQAPPLPQEPPLLQNSGGGGKYEVFENEPNNGYRQPVRRALASNTKPEVFTDKCNDERLKKIIEQNIDTNPSTSKRKIQKAATDEIGGLFDVICSSHDFSYLANTQLFCEAGNDDVTCFAFLHSLIQ